MRVLAVTGTHTEAIKMAPVISALTEAEDVDGRFRATAPRDTASIGMTATHYGVAFKPDIGDLYGCRALGIVAHFCRELDRSLLVAVPNNVSLPPARDRLSTLVRYEQLRRLAHVHVTLVYHKQFEVSHAPAGRIVDTRRVWR